MNDKHEETEATTTEAKQGSEGEMAGATTCEIGQREGAQLPDGPVVAIEVDGVRYEGPADALWIVKHGDEACYECTGALIAAKLALMPLIVRALGERKCSPPPAGGALRIYRAHAFDEGNPRPPPIAALELRAFAIPGGTAAMGLRLPSCSKDAPPLLFSDYAQLVAAQALALLVGGRELMSSHADVPKDEVTRGAEAHDKVLAQGFESAPPGAKA